MNGGREGREIPIDSSGADKVYSRRDQRIRNIFKKGKDRHPAVRALPVRNWNMEELEFRYDTQLLIEGEDLDEDEIGDYFREHFIGDCLLAVGDDTLIKIHYHTNEPWKVLEYCASLGEIYDIVVEDMDRQSRGLQG